MRRPVHLLGGRCRAGDDSRRGSHGPPSPRPSAREASRLMDWVDWAILVVRVVIVFFALLIAVMLYIWMERKVIADMQTRVGPMRAGPRGVLITLADGIKLFFKEGITPTEADRPVYAIAPILAMFPGFLAFCVIPFGTERDAVRSRDPVPARRPEHRHPVDPRDDLALGLRRGARRLVERLELPVARRRALERADDLLRGRHGPGPRRGADVQRHAADERARRGPRHRVERRAAVPGVHGVPDRGASPRRTVLRSISRKPRPSSSPGSTPSTRASSSRCSTWAST